MTVMGIMMKPTDARATAPVVRFARLESRGSDEEEWFEELGGTSRSLVRVRISDRATFWRRALRVEKYRADPTPVRITEGSVPRHSCLSVLGPLTISWKVLIRDAEPDCWTRVLRRSAG